MRHTLSLIAFLSLAACGSPEPVNETDGSRESADPMPVWTVAPSATPSPETTPQRDYTPPRLEPEAERGAEGARNLLLAWAAAMEDRAFDAAYGLFGDYAGRAGKTVADYAAAFADYRTVHVAIGEGAVEGAAGSLYYEVPVTLSGTRQGRGMYLREGTITLRRVNDVPGAKPAELRWHLERLDWDK